jgi:methionyl aminopeptidase
VAMSGRIVYKSRRELDLMRKAGAVVAEVLQALAKEVRPGLDTAYLDALTFRLIKDRGGFPSFKGYRGYPASLCASVNSEVVHGIPRRDRILRQGDIVSLDVGVKLQGYHADAAITVGVGQVSETTRRLLDVTREALWKGILQAKEGAKLSDISEAIQKHAEANGYTIVREMVGHGVGRHLHEDPQVPNYIAPEQPNPPLRAGMTLAIEPMLNAGRPEVELLADKWTVVTRDRSLSAHFEHTVGVGTGSPEILTASASGEPLW